LIDCAISRLLVHDPSLAAWIIIQLLFQISWVIHQQNTINFSSNHKNQYT